MKVPMLLSALLLSLGLAQAQTVPLPQELPVPQRPPREDVPEEAEPPVTQDSGGGFPAFAVSYYAPSWFGIASGKGSDFSGLAGTFPSTRLLVPFEFRVTLWRWRHLSVAASLVPAVYAEDHRPASFNLSAGAGIFYNKFLGGQATESPLSGPYLMFYPVNDIALFAGGEKPTYRWKIGTDVGFAVALTPAPVPLYLGAYLRWLVGWQATSPWHGVDFGLTVGMLFL